MAGIGEGWRKEGLVSTQRGPVLHERDIELGFGWNTWSRCLPHSSQHVRERSAECQVHKPAPPPPPRRPVLTPRAVCCPDTPLCRPPRNSSWGWSGTDAGSSLSSRWCRSTSSTRETTRRGQFVQADATSGLLMTIQSARPKTPISSS